MGVDSGGDRTVDYEEPEPSLDPAESMRERLGPLNVDLHEVVLDDQLATDGGLRLSTWPPCFRGDRAVDLSTLFAAADAAFASVQPR